VRWQTSRAGRQLEHGPFERRIIIALVLAWIAWKEARAKIKQDQQQWMRAWMMSGLQNEDVRLMRQMIPTSSNVHFEKLPTPMWAAGYPNAQGYFTPDVDYIFRLLLPDGGVLPSFAEQAHSRLFASYLLHFLQLSAALEANFTSVEYLTLPEEAAIEYLQPVSSFVLAVPEYRPLQLLWRAVWLNLSAELKVAERGGVLLPTAAQHSELERCDRALAELDTVEDDWWALIQELSTILGAVLEGCSIRAFNFLQMLCNMTHQPMHIADPQSGSLFATLSSWNQVPCWISSGPNDLDVWWSTVWITLMEWRTKILMYDSACKWLLCAACGNTYCHD
jgi:hypothetical protein